VASRERPSGLLGLRDRATSIDGVARRRHAIDTQ
jgi:hypothetical protein